MPNGRAGDSGVPAIRRSTREGMLTVSWISGTPEARPYRNAGRLTRAQEWMIELANRNTKIEDEEEQKEGMKNWNNEDEDEDEREAASSKPQAPAIFRTPHSALSTQHSSLITPRSAFCPHPFSVKKLLDFRRVLVYNSLIVKVMSFPVRLGAAFMARLAGPALFS